MPAEPMKRLLVIRHAKAVARDAASDFARVLAPRGKAQMKAVARYLADSGLVPDQALVSPAARTRETWALAGFDEVAAVFDERIYDASVETLLDVVRDADPDAETVALVGHNPGLHELTIELAGGEGRAAAVRRLSDFPTASVALVELGADTWRAVKVRSGRLASFVTPDSPGAGD